MQNYSDPTLNWVTFLWKVSEVGSNNIWNSRDADGKFLKEKQQNNDRHRSHSRVKFSHEMDNYR